MVIPFDNSFARLPKQFFVPQTPTPVKSPQLVIVNKTLAADMGININDIPVDVLAGNRIPEGATPIATAYAGHQFGGFSPQLGDGRAVLLGEVIAPDGTRRDLQLKGTGRTMFSRGGDGRATLGAVLREYVLSEAMAAMHIPTTRALGAVTTGEYVPREDMHPGAVLARVAASHIRVGTFQFHYARRDEKALKILADHVIARHYPQAKTARNPMLALLENVMERQAVLIAKWMQIGFIHGVMNTDNMAITGETIDYGPCAFMDGFDSNKVFSSIDHAGRYAWDNQPKIAHWNLTQFANTLIPLIDDDQDKAVAAAQDLLGGFSRMFTQEHTAAFSQKLGLLSHQSGDSALIDDLLTLLAAETIDFTLFFRNLRDFAKTGGGAARAMFKTPAGFDIWMQTWQRRTVHDDAKSRADMMQRANPAFIPRNHRLEQLITAAEDGDLAPFNTLMRVLAKPYDDQPEYAKYALPPQPKDVVHKTFCGT